MIVPYVLKREDMLKETRRNVYRNYNQEINEVYNDMLKAKDAGKNAIAFSGDKYNYSIVKVLESFFKSNGYDVLINEEWVTKTIHSSTSMIISWAPSFISDEIDLLKVE